MSDQPEQNETSWSNLSLSLMAAVGFILLFVLILWVAYVPLRPEPIPEVTKEKRLETLAEVRNAGLQNTTTYGVVNPNEGIYRIPVDRAMDLTVAKYRQEAKVGDESP